MATRAQHAGGRGRRALYGALVVGVLVGLSLVAWGLRPVDPPSAPLPERTFDHAWSAGATAPDSDIGRPPAPPYRPDRLLIPSLGIDAPLVAEGLDTRGNLVVPGDPGTVGVWDGGPQLGAAEGTTLLAGHVDVAGMGPGALIGLSRVAPGAWVITTDGLGRGRAWRVDSLVVRGKDHLPAFPATGVRRLAIVTCGGPLLRTPSGNTYRDNVIAFAMPAAP